MSVAAVQVLLGMEHKVMLQHAPDYDSLPLMHKVRQTGRGTSLTSTAGSDVVFSGVYGGVDLFSQAIELRAESLLMHVCAVGGAGGGVRGGPGADHGPGPLQGGDHSPPWQTFSWPSSNL